MDRTPYKGTIQTLAVNAIRRMDVTPACVHSSVTMRETMREIVICEIMPTVNRINVNRVDIPVAYMQECVDAMIDALYPVA